MTTSEKLEFIRQNERRELKELRIFAPQEIQDIPANVLPTEWYDIFAQEDKNARIQGMLNIWKRYVKEEYSRVIAYLEDNILDIDLVKMDDRYYVFYVIQKIGGKITYYEGDNPLQRVPKQSLAEHWDKLPQSLRDFYEHVHYGFCDYFGSMGLNTLKYAELLSEYDVAGVFDESKIDIDHSFEFFTNGGGGRVLLDVSNPSENNATIWFTFDPDNIDYGQKFWDVIDDWTFMGLSEDF